MIRARVANNDSWTLAKHSSYTRKLNVQWMCKIWLDWEISHFFCPKNSSEYYKWILYFCKLAKRRTKTINGFPLFEYLPFVYSQFPNGFCVIWLRLTFDWTINYSNSVSCNAKVVIRCATCDPKEARSGWKIEHIVWWFHYHKWSHSI